MTIESNLESIAKSLDRIANATEKLAGNAPAPETNKPAKAEKPAKPQKPAEPDPEPEPAAEASQGEPETGEPEVTRDDCAKAITDAVAAGKRGDVVALLERHGAKKLADMDPANYAEFYAALQAVTSE